ncbi:NAD(P)/FAD-dependent oxidoreductase [Mycobacterium shimoidei]|uniref:NAD(P)/FAD-dependent oxidoreductase n=1 Tax=Mycobacterium shimoidei TaxID=29313 RepID=UPI0008496D08|nr:FAD-binding oxidoreductase [Mycobacterium shimoidei]MCV7258255.1 FAD-binding oxidoreductase [Mycobacterium shimoidei]ODR12941.1 amino acid dehydrogenase [Mycobacterium shimoidei]ORW82089.1 amino acid dehydrogenase [Mycobacterium shimoidei]
MAGVERIDGGPRSAIVVGAGIVGLSTAWFLQDRGVEVTVVDRIGVAAGASAGNGGWIAPGLTLPLNMPGALRHGLSRLLADSGRTSWRRAMRTSVSLNEDCIEAFDVLIAHGIDVPVTDAPITAVFRSTAEAERMLWQLRELENAGQAMYLTGLSGEALREQVPLASPAITAGLNINCQRFVDPRRFVEALGRCVVERGATMRRLEISEVVGSGSDVTVRSGNTTLSADAAVVATGAALSALAGRWLRVPVQAACGYSFRVPVDRPMPSPIYLPDRRVACTPDSGSMRVSGTLELCDRHKPAIPQRLEAIIGSVSPLLDGARWAERSDLWAGAYSVTPDGRPVIGEVSPGIYVAGGHGMWGLAHGPVTGRLLAEQITTGKQPPALADVDPLRTISRWH